ncbi:MAG: hypothetical protein ACRD0V_15145 [Acidimicrobiales bacterium]
MIGCWAAIRLLPDVRHSDLHQDSLDTVRRDRRRVLSGYAATLLFTVGVFGLIVPISYLLGVNLSSWEDPGPGIVAGHGVDAVDVAIEEIVGAGAASVPFWLATCQYSTVAGGNGADTDPPDLSLVALGVD